MASISDVQAGTIFSLTTDISLASMLMRVEAEDGEGPSLVDFVRPSLTPAIRCPFFSTLKRPACRGLSVSIEASVCQSCCCSSRASSCSYVSIFGSVRGGRHRLFLRRLPRPLVSECAGTPTMSEEDWI